MRRGLLRTACGILGLFLLAGGLSSSTDSSGEKRAQGNDILGVWTHVHSEVDGDGTASISNPGGRSPAPRPGAPGGGASSPFLWKISKEEMQASWDNPNLPSFRYHYRLNPGGKMGTIDLATLDKEGKKTEAKPMKGIYLLTDDILMICYALDGAPRPEHFTTSAKSRSVLVILRRGKEVLAGR